MSSIHLFLYFVRHFGLSRWGRKFKVFLNNQQERIGILQIVKPFFSLCLLKLFLNNRLVSNSLLTEIDKSNKYFPLTFRLQCIVHWAQNWPIVCDACKCKIFNPTCKNSPMNSIVLQRDGSRNELSFENFIPSTATHFFISFTLKNVL